MSLAVGLVGLLAGAVIGVCAAVLLAIPFAEVARDPRPAVFGLGAGCAVAGALAGYAAARRLR